MLRGKMLQFAQKVPGAGRVVADVADQRGDGADNLRNQSDHQNDEKDRDAEDGDYTGEDARPARRLNPAEEVALVHLGYGIQHVSDDDPHQDGRDVRQEG